MATHISIKKLIKTIIYLIFYKISDTSSANKDMIVLENKIKYNFGSQFCIFVLKFTTINKV